MYKDMYSRLQQAPADEVADYAGRVREVVEKGYPECDEHHQQILARQALLHGLRAERIREHIVTQEVTGKEMAWPELVSLAQALESLKGPNAMRASAAAVQAPLQEPSVKNQTLSGSVSKNEAVQNRDEFQSAARLYSGRGGRGTWRGSREVSNPPILGDRKAQLP